MVKIHLQLQMRDKDKRIAKAYLWLSENYDNPVFIKQDMVV